MLRYVLVGIVLAAGWLHYRAAYTPEVRRALADLPASTEELDELLYDLRDRRLFHRCRAVLADQQAGDHQAFEEHMADALERLDHLERFAPLRRLLPR